MGVVGHISEFSQHFTIWAPFPHKQLSSFSLSLSLSLTRYVHSGQEGEVSLVFFCQYQQHGGEPHL